jgi:hypothetical protein
MELGLAAWPWARTVSLPAPRSKKTRGLRNKPHFVRVYSSLTSKTVVAIEREHTLRYWTAELKTVVRGTVLRDRIPPPPPIL